MDINTYVAQRMGMKTSEIIDVREAGDDGFYVTTHDAQVSFLPAAGDPMPLAAMAAEAGAAAGDEEPPAQTGGQVTPPADVPVVGGKNKIADIVTWVEADPELVAARAQEALTAEYARPDAERRSQLITKLEQLAGQ